MKYHQKMGTTRFCFKNDDHRNLDISKSFDIIQLIELHQVLLNSVIMAKDLYQEFIGKSDLAFQDNLLTSNYISRVADKILQNSLSNKLANNSPEDHQEQIEWIIRELERINSERKRQDSRDSTCRKHLM